MRSWDSLRPRRTRRRGSPRSHGPAEERVARSRVNLWLRYRRARQAPSPRRWRSAHRGLDRTAVRASGLSRAAKALPGRRRSFGTAVRASRPHPRRQGAARSSTLVRHTGARERAPSTPPTRPVLDARSGQRCARAGASTPAKALPGPRRSTGQRCARAGAMRQAPQARHQPRPPAGTRRDDAITVAAVRHASPGSRVSPGMPADARGERRGHAAEVSARGRALTGRA